MTRAEAGTTGSISEEIARYLRSGDYDPHFSAWPGNLWERAPRADADLKGALVAEVRERAGNASPPAVPDTDLVALTRRKVGPMVRGLFPAREQERVLSVLERSVVVLTPATIAEALSNAAWLSTAWDLANLYLGSVGAELLSPEAPRLLGLSEETTCYVSAEYFEDSRLVAARPRDGLFDADALERVYPGEQFEPTEDDACSPSPEWYRPPLDSLSQRPLGDSKELRSLRDRQQGVGHRCHRFADFIVHEVAHVFHNCKRRTVGLPETRTREWLLEIEYRKRETFAHACEAYSRILELGSCRADRVRLLEELAAGALPDDERVDTAEYLDILREAVTSRNGWKRILARCGHRPRSSRAGGALEVQEAAPRLRGPANP